MRKVFTVLFTILCVFAYSQQISLYAADKLGIGLNADKTFSPEVIFKAQRHSMFTQYWMYYPAIGCKVRYYKNERGYIYTGIYAAAVFANNTETGEWIHNIFPDIHLCGVEIYPFNRDYLGFSIYLRTIDFDFYKGYSALMIRF